jgi:hypothetical protein
LTRTPPLRSRPPPALPKADLYGSIVSRS